MDDKNKQPQLPQTENESAPNVVVGGEAPSEPTLIATAPTDEPNIANESDANDDETSQSWTAPEFISYDKTSTWYLYLFVICAVLCGLVLLLLKDIISVIVIIIAFLLVGVYGSRKPKVISYSIDDQAVQVGTRRFFFNEFRNYSVVHEGSFSSVTLIPLKRFAVSVSIYFPQQNEPMILSIISGHLPFEQHNPDLVDRQMTRIRY